MKRMSALSGRPRRFIRNESAAVSVEFVFMTLFMIGVVAIFIVVLDAFIAINKGVKANSTISNYVSRLSSISNTQIDDLKSLYNNIALDRSDRSWVRLTTAFSDSATGEMVVCWSYSSDNSVSALTTTSQEIEDYVPEIASGHEIVLLETQGYYTPRYNIVGLERFDDFPIYNYTSFIVRSAPQFPNLDTPDAPPCYSSGS